jgi:hypothetical protein
MLEKLRGLNKQYEELAIKRNQYEKDHPNALRKHWSSEEYKTLSEMNNELQFINAQAEDLREEYNLYEYPNVPDDI